MPWEKGHIRRSKHCSNLSEYLLVDSASNESKREQKVKKIKLSLPHASIQINHGELCRRRSLTSSILTVIENRYFPSNFIFLSHSELYSHNNKIAAALCIVKYNILRKKSQVTEEVNVGEKGWTKQRLQPRPRPFFVALYEKPSIYSTIAWTNERTSLLSHNQMVCRCFVVCRLWHVVNGREGAKTCHHSLSDSFLTNVE